MNKKTISVRKLLIMILGLLMAVQIFLGFAWMAVNLQIFLFSVTAQSTTS